MTHVFFAAGGPDHVRARWSGPGDSATVAVLARAAVHTRTGDSCRAERLQLEDV
jgi:hypothetical protein